MIHMHVEGGTGRPIVESGIKIRLESGTTLSQCTPGPNEILHAFTRYVQEGRDPLQFHKQEWVSIR